MLVEGKHRCISCFKEKNSDADICSCGFDESQYVCGQHCLQPGTMLNDVYCIGRVIGEGGFGITYAGYDVNLEIKVAIKEFYLNGFNSRNVTVSNEIESSIGNRKETFEANREKFINEARILAKFNNEPGIVSVLNFFKHNNTAYIIMEYLDGMNLKEYISEHGNMSPEEAVDIFIPIIRTLNKVHSANLIHRDISPDNIIYTNNKKAKLLDFGATRETSDSNKSLSVILKHGYSPIEQYQSHGNQGPWTDVYAICATMYKCLTGVTPVEAAARTMGEAVTPPCELVDNCSRAVSDVIMKGMEIAIDRRYKSMVELENALSKAFQEGKTDEGEETLLLFDDKQEDKTLLLFDDKGSGNSSTSYERNATNDAANSITGNKADSPKQYGGDSDSRELLVYKLAIGIFSVIAIVLAIVLVGIFRSNKNAGASSGAKETEAVMVAEETAKTFDDIDDTDIAKESESLVDDDTSYESSETDTYEIEKVERRLNVAWADASSTLVTKSVDNATYGAEHLIDGRYDTVWCEGKKDSGIGESFTLHFGSEKEITYVVIYNGFLQTKYRYSINGRVTKIRISADNGSTQEASVKVMYPGEEKVTFSYSELGETRIDFSQPIKTSSLTFTILDVESGTKYKDTMISEVEVYGYE